MSRFNPLDPLGIFQPRDSTPATEFRQIRYRAGTRAEGTIREFLDSLWPPPDPLGIFQRSNPGNPGRRPLLLSPPDPLGIFGKRGTIGNPIPIEFDGRLVDMKKQARETLIARGYPATQVDMALKWAEEWLMGMARRMAPGNIELQKSVVQSAYAEIASRAERWLQGIEAAFAGSVR